MAVVQQGASTSAQGAQATAGPGAGAQHDENLRRLAARKAQYGDTLLGEEIVGLRKRYYRASGADAFTMRRDPP